ncbi:hypothetical protein ThvES_00011500 [Thiovulum sp. ES]|nr:hypothetical protein ThvES_00011500 [Thiovulum sp. ES]
MVEKFDDKLNRFFASNEGWDLKDRLEDIFSHKLGDNFKEELIRELSKKTVNKI